MKSDRDMTESPAPDAAWGDATEGPVRGKGDELPAPSPTGVTERMLNRDEQRDPWSGKPVQDTSELPSGTQPEAHPPRDSMTNPDDPRTGGEAGLVGKDDRLVDRGK